MNLPEEHGLSIHQPPSPLVRHAERSGAAAAPGGAESRRASRVAHVHGPAVRVEIRKPDGECVQGVVEDCCWSGAAVRFGYTDDPRIGADQVGIVIVRAPNLPDLTLHARVASAEPRVSGGTRYGLEFVDEEELARQVTTEWRRWFSRRRTLRFAPRDPNATTIYVEWESGRSRGRVVDASIDGIGVELDVETARRAIDAGEIVVLLAFPGSGGTMKLNAKVRRTRQGVPGVQVGLELVKDARFESCRERIEVWAARAKASQPSNHGDS